MLIAKDLCLYYKRKSPITTATTSFNYPGHNLPGAGQNNSTLQNVTSPAPQHFRPAAVRGNSARRRRNPPIPGQASLPVFRFGSSHSSEPSLVPQQYHNNYAQSEPSLANNAQLTQPYLMPQSRNPLPRGPSPVSNQSRPSTRSNDTSILCWESTLAPPPTCNSQSFATKSFCVKPFDPQTTEEQIVAYIQGRTGWDASHFNCRRLTSDSRSDARPLTFVSFKVTVPDHPDFIHSICDKEFWPSFVSVDAFTLKRRS